MSFTATNWAYSQTCRSGTAKAVLAYLANCADQKGECFPGLEAICRATDHGIAAVKRAILHLIEDHQLDRERRTTSNGRDTSYRYRLPVSVVREGYDFDPLPRGTISTPSEGYDFEGGRGTKSHGNPSREPVPSPDGEGALRTRARPAHPIADDWQPSEAGVAFAMQRDIVDIEAVVLAFVAHHQAKQNRLAWDAAWRTWCLNEQRFQRRDAPRDRLSVADQIRRDWGLDRVNKPDWVDDEPLPALVGEIAA